MFSVFSGFVATLLFGCSTPVFAADLLYKIVIDGAIIHPVTAEYIGNAIDRAEESDAPLLIQLDTPGGLLESTREIVKRMLNSKVSIIVYVAPAGARAASAGTFITMAAHVAAMAPSTHMGAAHPVEMGGGGKKWTEKAKEALEEKKTPPGSDSPPPATQPMEDKILNDTLAWVDDIATARGRNKIWGRKAVTHSISDSPEILLRQKVIDLIAADEKELLEKLEGRTVSINGLPQTLHLQGTKIQTIEMNWRQSILNTIINPNIAYILMSLGFYALLFELKSPGGWVPGIVGVACLLMALYSFNVIPTHYAGIILTGVGFILLAAELFVTSFGLLALAGLICLFLGALFLIDSPADYWRLSKGVAIPTVLGGLAIFGTLAALVFRSRGSRITTGAEGLIGQTAMTDTDLNPTGKVEIRGEIWNAEADTSISAGTLVQIYKVESLRLFVRVPRNQ